MKTSCHNQTKQKINKKFWIKNIFFISLFIYFIIINILEPKGPIKWTWHYSIWLPLTSYVIFWEGKKYFKLYPNIIKRIFDMNTLIGLASHILYIFSITMVILNWNKPIYEYSQMWEGPAILILVTNLGHALESKIQKSSAEAYQKLDNMRNSKVIVIKDNRQIIDKASKLKIGDVILIKRGDIVPLDGKINSNGIFDYSNITGESNAILIKKGKEVISGSYNLGNAIKIVITKKPSESTLSTLIDKIESVSIAKPKIQKLVDKILKWFVPAIILISILTAIIWTLINYTVGISLPWISNKFPSWILGISAGVTVMAIACPCSLGIATPLVYAVSSLLSSKNGIIINNTKSLEELSKIKTFCFDKTGTITKELFKIISIEGNKELIGVAKSLEKNINHPIAKTILTLPSKYKDVKNIKHFDNKIIGIWKNQQVEIRSIKSKNHNTNIALYINQKPKLIFQLKNIIKDGVIDVIRMLNANGIKTIMITGDNKQVAKNIAQEVGIDKVYYEIGPKEKADIISKLQQKSKVAFVGDGFNDSVAIKKSNVSISFASGSDISNALSDISILKNDFISILNLINISKMNNFSIKLALIYAFSFNMIAIPVAILMMIQPWVGASIMAISDILVVLNAFIYKARGKRKLKNMQINNLIKFLYG